MSVSQAVSSLGAEHDIIVGDFPIENLSTVWIPFSNATGRIVAAYTGDEGPVAKYAFTDPQTWISGTSPQTQRRWDDSPAWPAPSNFCAIYPSNCDADNNPLAGAYDFVGAPVALTTDHVEVVAIVAVLHTVDAVVDSHDVVVVTSIDGGQTFVDARIISTGVSGGHERPQIDRVDATAILSTEIATERDRDSTTANIVVWRGGLENTHWWGTKILVDPSDGHVALLQDPRRLEFMPENAGHLTVRAWEEDGEGLETIAFLWSERVNRDGTPFGGFQALPSCPTDEVIQVRWRYRRARGLFDHDSNVQPNWIEPGTLLDEDREWRPCVGPSHSVAMGAPPYFVNSDRADMVINRRPWFAKIAYARTDPSVNLTRIFTATRNLAALGGLNGVTVPPTPDPLIEILPAPAGTEEYNPKLALGQGRESDYPVFNGTDWPRLALVRKRVAGSLISIVALTEEWELRLPEPGQSFPGAYRNQDDQTIAAGAAPTAMEGTTLGLTVQPICVHEDYGPCTSGGLITRIFHATYPRSGSNAVKGISFAH